MSKRENSSLILQNLKKRELRVAGEPIVPLSEAERRLGQSVPDVGDATSAPAMDNSYPASTLDSHPASYPDSIAASVQSPQVRGSRLRPRERVARSALIVRLNPALHRELEEVARFNKLTMNDIAIEALELHLRNFPHPPAGHGDR